MLFNRKWDPGLGSVNSPFHKPITKPIPAEPGVPKFPSNYKKPNIAQIKWLFSNWCVAHLTKHLAICVYFLYQWHCCHSTSWASKFFFTFLSSRWTGSWAWGEARSWATSLPVSVFRRPCTSAWCWRPRWPSGSASAPWLSVQWLQSRWDDRAFYRAVTHVDRIVAC